MCVQNYMKFVAAIHTLGTVAASTRLARAYAAQQAIDVV